MKWQRHLYVDLTLPFGLRSTTPFIFNSVADVVEWILLNEHHLSDLLHYLDDFITAARRGFTFSAVHVLGVQNKVADAIFRFRWQ